LFDRNDLFIIDDAAMPTADEATHLAIVSSWIQEMSEMVVLCYVVVEWSGERRHSTFSFDSVIRNLWQKETGRFRPSWWRLRVQTFRTFEPSSKISWLHWPSKKWGPHVMHITDSHLRVSPLWRNA
jgi:hypothetical protein